MVRWGATTAWRSEGWRGESQTETRWLKFENKRFYLIRSNCPATCLPACLPPSLPRTLVAPHNITYKGEVAGTCRGSTQAKSFYLYSRFWQYKKSYIILFFFLRKAVTWFILFFLFFFIFSYHVNVNKKNTVTEIYCQRLNQFPLLYFFFFVFCFVLFCFLYLALQCETQK